MPCGRKYGHVVSEETRSKISFGHLGKKATIATRKKMSDSARGKTKSPEHIRKVLETRSRLKCCWKGDSAGIAAMHKWVEKIRGKPSKCEHCGVEGEGRMYDWSNKFHTYRRIAEDYQRLCRSCHRKYDFHILRTE